MKKFSNESKISLAIAVWLAEDKYVHVPDPMHVSATALLKSTKQIVLASRLPELEPGTEITDMMLEDISNRVPSAWVQLSIMASRMLGEITTSNQCGIWAIRNLSSSE